MVKTPTVLRVRAPLSLRPPVALGVGVLVVKLEARELAELMTEEREEREEERSVESPDVVVVVGRDDEEDKEEDEDDKSDEPKEEVGGDSDVMVGRGGMEVLVELPRQASELPAVTVITGVALPTPLESESTITTLVPAAIVT